MSDDLASSVQLCFALYDLACQTDLNRKDVLEVAKLAGALQPVLLRLQKAVLQSDAVAADEQLRTAIGAVYAALQGLQQAACRCRVPHWLLRVLAARDIRQQLAAAFKEAATALQQLAAAAEADVVADEFPDSYLRQLQQLQQCLAAHKVHRHEQLEGLARGLLKHMYDERTDAQALPSMLKFVVKEAAAQTQLKALQHAGASGSSGTSSSSSRRGASTYSSNGASSSKAAAAADGGSSSSSSSRSGRDTGGLPHGETSLTDGQLLSELLQLAGSKADEEQAALYQIVSILEGLQDAKRQQQREHTHRRYQRRHHQQQQQQQGHLQRVSEADDDRADDGASNNAVAATAGQAGPGDASNNRNGDNSNSYNNGNVSDDSGGSSTGVGQQDTEASRQLKEVVKAMMAQLEEMLWMDPWDAAALMQIMELLLQVEDAAEQQQGEEEDESQEQQQQQCRQGLFGQRQARQASPEQVEDVQKLADQQGNCQQVKKGKWWQVGTVAKAALKSRTAGSSSSTGTNHHHQQQQQSAAAAAATAAQQQQQAAWRERVHALAAGALDVLLHLTPRPAGSSSSSSSDTFLKPCSRDGVCTEAGHSLALPLMAHADTVPALAACLWSGRTWPDVGLKAAQLLAILIDSGHAVAAAGSAAGVADGAAASYAAFCKKICSSGNSTSCSGLESAASGSQSSVWFGFVHMLHSSSHPAAGAAAEALTAVGRSRALMDLCSSLAAAQQARALLLLLSRYQLHNGAGGAAAAALHALAEPSLRPAMHNILANSYWDLVPGAAESLGALLLQLLVGNDALAAARAAELAASLVGDVAWEGKGEMWLETFKAGQRLLALRGGRSRGSGSVSGCGSVSSSRSRACGAALLAQLVGENFVATAADGLGKAEIEALQQQQRLSPMLAVQIDAGERDDLLFEVLQMCVQQFSLSGSWEGMDCAYSQASDSSRSSSSKYSQQRNEGLAAVQLLGSLLSWLPVEGVACAMPELHAVVLPVLEHLAATQGSLLSREARRVQDLILSRGQ